ncbi:MAG: putative transcriptional regulator, lambda repressor-like DNA-binding domain [Hyphomicrobiales bacterium]|nr:putative transcriptional regulator, lambda repressor-like DNA-binding domain [Hyphomicrobiales bacterium]
MSVELSKWDLAATFRGSADMAHFLDTVLEEAAASGDYSLLPETVGALARARGMTEIARETGLSRESLYKALSEDGNPSFATVMKVLQALSIELHAKARDEAKHESRTGPEAA